MNQVNHIDIGSPFFYGVFFVIVCIMLAIDLVALNKQEAHKVSSKEALVWTFVWVSIALCFAGWLYYIIAFNPEYGELAIRQELAKEKVLEYLTGYVLEKSLAIDNIFVFLMIFAYFKVPPQWQRRVLVYGVFGAIILRVVMIAIGAVLIREFSEILYFFGAFLIWSGYKMLRPESEHTDLSDNKVLGWLKRKLKVTKNFYGEQFFIKRNGVLYVTPLFLVLIMIELSDVVFAVDSIPAVFAVTTDPFIVMTSNVFAILGLRAMYFLLADMADRFHLLNYGLAIILIFIGIKMLIIKWAHIPTSISLGAVLVILVSSIVLSLYIKPKEKNHNKAV